MIVLPTRKRTKDPKNCNICKDELTKDNKYIYRGRLDFRCKNCLKAISRKHNEKRKKALKGNKLW